MILIGNYRRERREDGLDLRFRTHSSPSANKSASLPCRIRQRKSLLDDSVLTEESKDDPKSLAGISSLCLPSDNRVLIGSERFEGALERKCLLKNYKTPRIAKWKHYWVTICDHLLLFHEEKSLLFPTRTGLSHRSSYRDSPAKCQSITDWLIVLSERQPRNEIQLSDLNRGASLCFSSGKTLDLFLS